MTATLAAASEALPIDPTRLVFLGGLHRSGTSLIHRCLSDHPRISGFSGTGVPEDEGQHLQNVFPPAATFGGPGMFGFRSASFMNEGDATVTPVHARRLLASWAPHWDLGRDRLIEKSPPTLVRTRYFQALFPGCSFIMVLRHPIAVAYATQKWVPAGVWVGSLIEHWLICHERFEQDRDRLEHVHVLRYEDFVERPQEHLDAMLRFIGLPAEPLARKVETGVNDRYFERWRKRRDNPLTRPYTNHLIAKFEDRVQRFGYTLRID